MGLTSFLVARRDRKGSALDDEAAFVSGLSGTVLGAFVHGTVAMAEEGALIDALAAEGIADPFVIRLYPHTDRLVVGAYVVDEGGALTIGGAPYDPAELPAGVFLPPDEPAAEIVLQLHAPPNPQILASIAATGKVVRGPVGRFGLLIRPPSPRPPADLLAEIVSELPSPPICRAAYTFQPLFRLHPALLPLLVATTEGSWIIDRAAIVVEAAAVALVVAVLNDTGAHVLSAASVAEHGGPAASGVGSPGGRPVRLLAQVPSEALATLTRLPGVRSIAYVSRTPKPEGERDAQLVAGNFTRAGAAITVSRGYLPWLQQMGLSGRGVTLAFADTGVGLNRPINGGALPDLDRRQRAAFDYTDGKVKADSWGHGSHLAGLIAGAGADYLAEAAPQPFLMGLGVAPEAGFVVQNAIAEPVDPDNCPWWPPSTLLPYTRDAVSAGATILTMAWTTDGYTVGKGYTAFAAELDALVRDPTGEGIPHPGLLVVASAGNTVYDEPTTISEPKEAKNIVVVGATLNPPPLTSGGDGLTGVDGVAEFSAQGPALDGRIRPTVVAPGVGLLSTLAAEAASPDLRAAPVKRSGHLLDADDPLELAAYASLSGTSTAAALVAGAAGLLEEWWRAWASPEAPEPALTRALLVIGADDMATAPDAKARLDQRAPGHIPDPKQGWGRVNLGNVLHNATLDGRGPKRVYTGAVGPEDPDPVLELVPTDPTLPVRIVLAWTDPPGEIDRFPAVVNRLELEVTRLDSGPRWFGNRFEGGWSAPGGTEAPPDNLQAVYLQPGHGRLRVTVVARELVANARPPYRMDQPWQDYVLVVENAQEVRLGAAWVGVLDTSGSMAAGGFAGPMRGAWAAYAGTLGRGARLGLATFTTAGRRVIPAAVQDVAPLLLPSEIDAYATAVRDAAAGGGTNLAAGLLTGMAIARAEGVGGTDLVLLSDGLEVHSEARRAIGALHALSPKLRVHTVGLFPTSDGEVLSTVARRTGGRYLYAPTEATLGLALAAARADQDAAPILALRTLRLDASARRGVVTLSPERDGGALRIVVTWGNSEIPARVGEKANQPGLWMWLRTPDGHRLPPASSAVEWSGGDGWAQLLLPRARAGRWTLTLELRGAARLAVSVAAHVDGGPSLDLSLLERKGRLYAVARWDGLNPATGEFGFEAIVDRPFSRRALNAGHRAALASWATTPVDAGDDPPGHPRTVRLAAARRAILAEDGADIFAPLVAPLQLTATDASIDGNGPGWEAAYLSTELAGTYTVTLHGWARDARTGRIVCRAARASVYLPGRKGVPPTVVEGSSPGATGPSPSGPWFRPGEQIDIGDLGFTTRLVWFTDANGIEQTGTHSTTGGGAHFRMRSRSNPSLTLGHLVALGGGSSPFALAFVAPAPVLTPSHVAPTTTSTNKADAYAVGFEHWRWDVAANWPDIFDLVPGNWSAPLATDQGFTTHRYACTTFSGTTTDITVTVGDMWRVTRFVPSAQTWRTIAFVRHENDHTLTWYGRSTEVVEKSLSEGTWFVLPFQGVWRFDKAGPSPEERGWSWYRLSLAPKL